VLLSKGLLIFTLLVVFVAVPVSVVSADNANSTLQNTGLTVTFGNNSSNMGRLMIPGTMTPMTEIQNYISQGQTQWDSGSITSYCQSFTVDLYWGNPSNSLSLTIYAPNGAIYGPYYDGCDGTLDGNIPVTISDSNGVPEGTYYFEIYGYQVTGSQWYEFNG